jgi:DNA replication licensing factor MCM5
MDRQSVYSAHVYEPSYGENGDTRLQLQQQLETFILDFRLDNNFVYRYVMNALMRPFLALGV